MLIDLANAFGGYLEDVFIKKLDFVAMIGLLGQALFTMRFLVQWLASEKAGRSVIPFAFWVFSVGGGVFLFGYALWRRDLVFILGQGFGIFIYLRNISLVLKDKRGRATQAQ
jgi:lipid-A-disaccharide synthase-like uncharacterized protein